MEPNGSFQVEEQAAASEKAVNVKIVTVGEMYTGKTCLVHRYLNGTYTDSLANTTGIAFSNKFV